jgi:serine protease Do
MKFSLPCSVSPLKMFFFAVILTCAIPGFSQDFALRQAVEEAVAQVKPALVRIHVVETYYREGRELKYEASGSGVVITPEGHVVTNHHVAGHAKQITCTFSDKSEVSAELVGTDPLTDIAVILLKPKTPRAYPVATFADSSVVRVGDHVLAMGSPLALSQSVTLGIVSNTEMMMPDWMDRFGGLEQDGENVGALVRWLGHDAVIFGGNSGGPLIDLNGKIIGINEIKMGLGGAIPGNLAKGVAEKLIDQGQVRRAWLGLELQPRLKHNGADSGVLVSGVLADSPSAEAGLQSGDLVLSVAGTPVDVAFAEQLPALNLFLSGLEIGQPMAVSILRKGAPQTISVTPAEREAHEPKQYELKAWGITVRDLSYMIAKEMKRPDTDGVLVTSVRPGGPAGAAKPPVVRNDVLVAVGEHPIKNVADLRAVSAKLAEESTEETVPALTRFERKTNQFVTVVKVGITELRDPGLEVKKAWLPVETQVITRDIAEHLGGDLKGFRVTRVFPKSTADVAGLAVGDLIVAVDGEALTASAPEHYEELPALIRQYRAGATVDLSVRRGEEPLTLPVELIRAPKLERESKKYRDDRFEFTVRDITFFDKADEQWKQEEAGVLVDQVSPGGWASLGQLGISDLIMAVDGQPIADVEAMEKHMKAISETKPEAVVFKVRRRIHTFFIELEPQWDLN